MNTKQIVLIMVVILIVAIVGYFIYANQGPAYRAIQNTVNPENKILNLPLIVNLR